MQQYALIGRKLGHSFSAKFFNEKFEKLHIDAHYSLVELPDFSGFDKWLEARSDIVGFNVTIPYKEEMTRRCDCLTMEAREIGAVNAVCVRRGEDGTISLTGTNTDAPGFMLAVEDELTQIRRETQPGERPGALVLGTGGASKAVCFALKMAGFDITLVSRTPGHSSSAHNTTAGPASVRKTAQRITYADLTSEIMEANRMIVNATPLGMWPDTDVCPDIPYDCLDDRYFCFDCIYNPEQTLFMKKSAAKGATVSNGLKMLENQAILAWQFWQNGKNG